MEVVLSAEVQKWRQSYTSLVVDTIFWENVLLTADWTTLMTQLLKVLEMLPWKWQWYSWERHFRATWSRDCIVVAKLEKWGNQSPHDRKTAFFRAKSSRDLIFSRGWKDKKNKMRLRARLKNSAGWHWSDGNGIQINKLQWWYSDPDWPHQKNVNLLKCGCRNAGRNLSPLTGTQLHLQARMKQIRFLG